MYNIHNVKNISLSLQLKNLCNDTPWYIKGFASSLDSYAPSTRYSYVLTITTFLDFVHSSVPAYESFDRKHMPVSVFRSIPLELFDSLLKPDHRCLQSILSVSGDTEDLLHLHGFRDKKKTGCQNSPTSDL